jgi:hypothetical protein
VNIDQWFLKLWSTNKNNFEFPVQWYCESNFDHIDHNFVKYKGLMCNHNYVRNFNLKQYGFMMLQYDMFMLTN